MNRDLVFILMIALFSCFALYLFFSIAEEKSKKRKKVGHGNKKKDKKKDYTCDNCGTDVYENDKVCPGCGLTFEDKTVLINKTNNGIVAKENIDNNILGSESKIIKDDHLFKEYVDVKFMNNSKIYTYLAPSNIFLKKGEYYFIYQGGRRQIVEIVSDIYRKEIKLNYDYKKLDIIEKANEEVASIKNYNVYESQLPISFRKNNKHEIKHNDYPYNDFYYDEIIKKMNTIIRREEYERKEYGYSPTYGFEVDDEEANSAYIEHIADEEW